MDLIYGFVRAHGYEFATKSDHRTDVCSWCAQAKDTAVEHMRDANLKSTKSTKTGPAGDRHTVTLKRVCRILGTPADEEPRYGVPFMGSAGSTIGLGTPLRVHQEEPKRPVVLDLTEAEAAMVLRLLDREEDDQITEGDAHYQNGDGFEAQCAQARAKAEEAEKIADRLRKLLGKHLDKAYAGELGL